MKKDKKIYIVLTYTGTILSKIIKGYTKAEYCHVSIALDESLKEMYSFGRLNPYNPFIGGFVHESISSGTFKRFKNTKALIYSLELSNRQYNRLRKKIERFEKRKHNYKFNTIGLFASGFNIRIKRNNCFYCAEFVKHLMDTVELDVDLPEIVKPIDFKNIDNLVVEYTGLLRNYMIWVKDYY